MSLVRVTASHCFRQLPSGGWFLHAYMADSFNDYINSLFICMNPYPGPQSVLVMDNNINSQIWTTSTDMLWSVCISSSINLLAEPHHCMTDLLLHTVFMVTGQQLQGWFRHSGYLICSVPPMKKKCFAIVNSRMSQLSKQWWWCTDWGLYTEDDCDYSWAQANTWKFFHWPKFSPETPWICVECFILCVGIMTVCHNCPNQKFIFHWSAKFCHGLKNKHQSLALAPFERPTEGQHYSE